MPHNRDNYSIRSASATQRKQEKLASWPKHAAQQRRPQGGGDQTKSSKTQLAHSSTTNTIHSRQTPATQPGMKQLKENPPSSGRSGTKFEANNSTKPNWTKVVMHFLVCEILPHS